MSSTMSVRDVHETVGCLDGRVRVLTLLVLERQDPLPGSPVRARRHVHRESNPTLSPDGSLIAFARIGDSGTRNFYVKQIEGGEPLVLSSGLGDVYTPAWSPDGKLVAIPHRETSNTASAIYSLSLETAEKRRYHLRSSAVALGQAAPDERGR